MICDFCGFLAQVKATTVRDVDVLPDAVLGAAWGPQLERLDAEIYYALFVVLVDKKQAYRIYYLAADKQPKEMFKPRTPLSAKARRAGWQGFVYDVASVRDSFVCLT